MSARIDGLKTVQGVDKRIAALEKKTATHLAAMNRAATDHQRAVDAWKQRVLTGFDEGKIVDTPEPVRPEMLRLGDEHVARLRHEREGLTRARLEAISAAGPEVLDAASQAVAQIVEEATPLIAQLDECLGVLREAGQDLQAVSDAANSVSTVGVIKSPDRPVLDLLSLAAAVKTGADPLVGHRQHAERVLGMHVVTVGADGSSHSEPVSTKVDPEAERLRTAAYAAQAAGILGRAAPRPLGYRAGLI